MSMTLQQLKYVVTVAECGNITEAAKQLFVSQPTVTSAIHDLEKEMQIVIFMIDLPSLSNLQLFSRLTPASRSCLRICYGIRSGFTCPGCLCMTDSGFGAAFHCRCNFQGRALPSLACAVFTYFAHYSNNPPQDYHFQMSCGGSFARLYFLKALIIRSQRHLPSA